MAQKLQVMVTCDLHDEETEGSETVRFGFDGYDYEIDLCAEHSGQVQDQMQALISYARRTAGRRGRGRSAASGPGTARSASAAPGLGVVSDRERLKDIREWARSHGYPDLSSRGRIPRAVVEEYEAAH